MNGADVNWYSKQIKRVPMLTAAEEITLGTTVQEWLNHPDGPEQAPTRLQRRGRRAKDRMVEANLRLVMTVANKWSRQVPSAEYMDLVQAGNEGLIRAVEKFDPTRGYKFSTYAYWWIRQGVSRHIETRSRVIRLPSSVVQKLHQISAVTSRLVHELHRNPTKAELAEALEISVADLQDLMQRGDTCLSLDAFARGDTSLSTMIELIPDPKGMNFEEQMDQLEDAATTDQLLGHLAGLDDRQRFLIEGRVGMHGEKRSIVDLAKELNIKPSVAARLIREGQTKLRYLVNTRQPIKQANVAPPMFPAVYVELIKQLELDGWIDEVELEPQVEARPRVPRRDKNNAQVVQSSFW